MFSEQVYQNISLIKAKVRKDRTFEDLSFLANCIRHYSLYMVYTAASGHPGGPLGLADIYAYLFFKEMDYSLKDYKSSQDFLFLSNGHVCAVRYASMCLAGFFEESELSSFRQIGSRLQGHPSSRVFPEVINSSGSLGQGLSVAGGFALASMQKKSKTRTFVCMSDGECQEGMTWESAMSIAHYQTEITAFIDYNNIQIDGYTKDVMDLKDLRKKFESFGWYVIEANGHNFSEIEDAFEDVSSKKGPKMILFHTLLGKGVSFMENQPSWHGVPPKKEQYEKAIQEIGL